LKQKNKKIFFTWLNQWLKRSAANLPQKVIVKTGRLLGLFMYHVALRHRRIVKRNLQLIHPDWSQGHITEFSKEFFQNFSITIVEILQMPCLSKEDIRKRITIHGEENLLNAEKSPKGVIVVSAHIGNWEMLCLFVSCYFEKPFAIVGRTIGSRLLSKLIYHLRERFGNIVIDRKGAFSKMVKALRRGDAVGLLIDQGVKSSEGVDITFLGKNSNATPGAALLSIRCDCPVLPVFCVRQKDSSLAIIAEPPFLMEKTGNLRADLQVNTQKLTNSIEKVVNQYPEQWFWAHKKWKRHYPNFYQEDIARRKRKKAKRISASKSG
jgi:KDO2-lipid IV(A) lauroyltransferase